MKLKHGLLGGLLSFAAGLAGIGCLVTGFSFSVSWPLLIGIFALWTAACTALLFVRHGGKMLLGLLAAALGVMHHINSLLLQVENFLFNISRYYNNAYLCGVISWSGEASREGSLTWGLILAGCLVITVLCWTVLRRKPIVPAAVAALLPLAACCVVTDAVPDVPWLLMLLGVLTLLLVTQGVRRRSAREAVRLTALLLVPVLLMMTCLFWAMPPEQYAAQSQPIHEAVLDWVRNLPFVVQMPSGELAFSFGGTPSSYVDLYKTGPQADSDAAVMDVVARQTGALYLRGQMMDTYDGTSWSLSGSQTPDPYWPVQGLKERGTVQITTRAVHPIRYVPYYADGIQTVQDNPDREKTYSYQLLEPTVLLTSGADRENSVELEPYLQLPAQTRQRANTWRERNWIPFVPFFKLSRSAKANAILYMVQNSAVYDLQTPAMPETETDFAMWFLENSDSGYCTHFATAAVVLLRAAGVPARYVTGYTVSTVASRRITVTARDAHAWVEYLDEDMCWKVLDPTPGGANPGIEETTEPTETQAPTEETTQPTEESTQASTEASTAATEASAQPTGESTQPTGATAPTGDVTVTAPRDWTWLWRLLKVLLWTLAGVGAVLAQYYLRLNYRRRKLYQGDPNRRAVAAWKYARLLSRLLRVRLPRELWDLAEKAAFSQHRMTQEELEQFYAFHTEMLSQLQNWNWPLRTAVKLLLAVG